MPIFSPADLAAWSGGRWPGDQPARVTGVQHDSRRVAPNDLFVALSGASVDGHGFVAAAFARGAAAAMVSRVPPGPPAGPLLVVPDTLGGLQALARGYRHGLKARLVAITGSVGKTTVKEMIAGMLARLGPTYRSPGNWNSDIGLPLSLLAMDPDDAYGVLELGINHPGEMRLLADILRPHWGVVTNVGPVHLEFFESVAAIALEKRKVLEVLPPEGAAFLSLDSPWFDVLAAKSLCRVITLSTEKNSADYVGAIRQKNGGGLLVRERLTGLEYYYDMPLPGEHVRQDALAAIAVARQAGLACEAIAETLRAYQPLAMRWNRRAVAGVDFINDAYNANPLSMRAALQTFARLPGAGRKWLVLGGMRELGPAGPAEHTAIGREVAYHEWAGLVVVGAQGALIAAGAESEGLSADRIFRCADNPAAVAVLAARLGPGDLVLLKASRGEHLEEVLEAYERQAAAGPGITT